MKVTVVLWKEDAQEAAMEAAAEVRPRERQEKWDESNMRTASCRLRREELEALREECRKQGTTVYGLIRYMIGVYMARRRRR